MKLNRKAFTMMECIITMMILGAAMYISVNFYDRMNEASRREDTRIKILSINTALAEEIKTNFYNGTIEEEAEDSGMGLKEFIEDKYSDSVKVDGPEASLEGPYYTIDVIAEEIHWGIERNSMEVKDREGYLTEINGGGPGTTDYVKYSDRFSTEVISDDGETIKITLKDNFCGGICTESMVAEYKYKTYKVSKEADIVKKEIIEKSGLVIPIDNDYTFNSIQPGTVGTEIVISWDEYLRGKPLYVTYNMAGLTDEDGTKHDVYLEYVYKNDLMDNGDTSNIIRVDIETEYEFRKIKNSKMTLFLTTPKETNG